MNWLEQSISYDLPEQAEDYLLSRGVSRSLMEEMRFGWWDQQSEPADKLVRERYLSMLRKFEGRVIVPIFSPQGRVVGVEARCLKGEHPKSLRLLTTQAQWNPLFVGLSPNAMERIWNGSDVWLVEGIFDVTSLQGLFGQTVVVLGTMRAAVTRKHLDFLKRTVTGSVYVAYDNDKTGQDSMRGFIDDQGRSRMGVVERISGLGLSCTPVHYRGGKDPNEIWENGGIASLRKSFSMYL